MGDNYNYCFKILTLYLLFIIVGCATPNSDFNKRYKEEWKKVIKSQAWNDALGYEEELASSEAEEIYTDKLINAKHTEVDYTTAIRSDVEFNKKFHSLISRAYFKIIMEAEKADERLKQEFDYLNNQKQEGVNKENPNFKEQLNLVTKKYHAHSEMLEGLKAWNIFSEQRTGDLEFFKKENVNTVYGKYQMGEAEDAIIGFLVYQLADLYHFESE